MSYIGNIEKETKENNYFRKVIFTGSKSQLVVMEIPIGGEIGEETHDHVEQTLFFTNGKCRVILNGEEKIISSGDVVVVTPGTKHNFVNVGDTPLKVYTVYAPANHIDGTIHKTKIDADNDKKDEEFGHSR